MHMVTDPHNQEYRLRKLVTPNYKMIFCERN